MNTNKFSQAFCNPLIPYTNIAFLPAKYDEFFCCLEQTRYICTESWLNVAIPDSLYSLPGHSIYSAGQQGRRGGGVCIYVSHSINSIFKVTRNTLPKLQN